jgi:murein L,D-transpeptidase YcbB/YkuD
MLPTASPSGESVHEKLSAAPLSEYGYLPQADHKRKYFNKETSKMKIRPAIAFLVLIIINLMICSFSLAQVDLANVIIEEKIDGLWTTGELNIGYADIASKHWLPGLYERNDFQLLWQNSQNVEDLLTEIGNIAEDGLNPEDYHLSQLLVLKLRLDESKSPDPSLLADYDILLTDSLVRLCYHIQFGKVDPETLDPAWNMTRQVHSKNPVAAIEKRLQTGTLAEGLRNIRPKIESYHLLKSVLKKYRAVQDSGGWETLPEGPTLKPGMTDQRVPQLRKRLAVTGDFPGTVSEDAYYDEDLKAAVMRFQYKHRLEADGAVGKNTYAALNIPVKQKIDQIRVNLERARWIFHKLPPDFVAVDIAGFRVYHYEGITRTWTSKVQVGKPFRKTPVFKSKIKYMVFNPTWTVPPTILQKDILPKIKKNPDYLRKMKISVIDRKGKIVDPNSVNWSKYSKSIPYTLRQEPGPHNALGRIKFIFPNKYFIYLHDTPSRALFVRKDRAFSSGCIRVDNDIELAELLLDDPDKWNREKILALLDTQKTQRVNLPKPKPVMLLYVTVWFDENDNFIFKKDVYARDQPVLKGLNEEFSIWQRRVFDQ